LKELSLKKSPALIVALVASIAALVLSSVAISVGFAASSSSEPARQITFTHGEIEPTMVTTVEAVSSSAPIGFQRFFQIPATSPENGMLSGSLTVLAEDYPGVGQELRVSNLIFQFGSLADQLVVGGVAAYEVANPTLGFDVVTTRPILGGTGTFAGATGEVDTTHNSDGTWTHVFRYEVGK